MFFRPVHVTHNVTEKRAPTDESVKLLRDMEQQARDEVIKAMQIPSTTVSGVVHAARDLMQGQIRARAITRLNDLNVVAEVSISEWGAQPYKLAEALRDELAKRIATAILEPAFQEMLARDGGPFQLK